MTQLSKKIPVEDPNVLLGIRVLYVVSNLIIFGLYFYMQMQINKKKGQRTLQTELRSALLIICRFDHFEIR